MSGVGGPVAGAVVLKAAALRFGPRSCGAPSGPRGEQKRIETKESEPSGMRRTGARLKEQLAERRSL